MAGAIGVIIAVIFLVRHIRSNGKPDRTNPPDAAKYMYVWVGYIALSCFVSIGIISLTALTNPLPGRGIIIVFMLCSSIVLFPALFAQLAIYLGRVKISYYLGRIAYSLHQKDIVAGALFYGWRALQHAKVENKTADQQWLEQRLAGFAGTLGSGAMLMHALIKAAPLSYKDLRAHFKLLQGLNKNWIPPNIARSAFRFILARSCTERDFNEIRSQARYWQLVGSNRFAQWVDMYHWSIGVEKIPWLMRIKIAWLYWQVGNLQLKHYLPQLKASCVAASPVGLSLAELKHTEVQLLGGVAETSELLNAAWRAYITGPAADEWMPRIKQLGCFNAEEVFERLQQSVRDLMSLRSGEGDLDSEAAMQERENGFKLLQIKITAMTNRSEQNKLMTGIQEYEEFLALVRVAERIGKDDHSRAQVFFQMRSPVWNWMVALWNTTKNRPLAFLAGNYMAPLAQEFGDTEAYDFFAGIVGHKFN